MRKRRENWKQHVARNFDRAVHSYEAHSPVQKQTAQDLTDLISTQEHLDVEHILELGCGTGHLTRAVYEVFPKSEWLISDISPHMVSRCMAHMPQGPKLKYTVMDAEELRRPERFDIICSNLTAQWFEDTEGTIQNLLSHLNPGGLLAISTLGPKTFALWRQSFEAAGSKPVMPSYPTADEWKNMFPKEGKFQHSARNYSVQYNSAFSFARALKDIGAHSHSRGNRQLNPGLVRTILRHFEELHNGSSVSADYDIYFITYRKPGNA